MGEFSWQLIEFRQPGWLLLALQPLFMHLFSRLKTNLDSTRYADEALLPWVIRSHDYSAQHWLRLISIQLVWVLIAFAMAGPRLSDSTIPAASQSRSDIMMVIDLSRSMTATDIQPERISRVRSEIFHILENNKTDRIGMVVYAGDAYLLSPPTWDRKVSKFFLESIKIGMLPTEGSHMQSAIELANRQLQNSERGTVFLFTDGESHESFSMTPELTATPLFVFGVGTEQGSSLLSEDGSWLTYNNTAVRSSLHTVKLRQLATASNGAYVTANRELGRLHQAYLSKLSSRKSNNQLIGKSWKELYHFPLVAALLLLAGLSIRVKNTNISKAATPFLVLLICANFFSTDRVEAATLQKKESVKARQFYSKGDYIQSASIYARYEGYHARMGEGASAYKMEDFARSTTQFTRAFLVAGDDVKRANALYNLANSYFKKAQYLLAQSTYEDVLRYHVKHPFAASNLKFVNSLIKSLADDPFASAQTTKRAGRGPRSVYAREDTQGSGDFSLDDEPAFKTPTTDRRQDSESLLSTQIASGKARVQVADDEDQSGAVLELDTVTTSQILQARRQVLDQQREQAELWKSLLEDEAGFPAPVQQPIILPGDLPW